MEPLQRRLRWESQYRNGPTPWDTGITPPEVRTFWSSNLLAPAGIALDMGCGTGTNVAYLASLGLVTVGLELSFTAILKGQERMLQRPAEVAVRSHLLQADVARPPLRDVGAVYVLDIGCLHTVPRAQRRDYANAVIANMAPGAYYHLYSHERQPGSGDADWEEHGLDPSEIASLFTPELSLVTVIRGRPQQRPCHWHLLHKPDRR